MSFDEQLTPSDPFGHFRGAGSIPATISNPPVYSAPTTSSSRLSWAPRRGHTETNATMTSKPANVRFTNSTPANGHSVIKEKTSGDHSDYIQSAIQTAADRNLELMYGHLALNRIPVGKPAIFDGKNPLDFPLWKTKFEVLISNQFMSDTDRISLLSEYLSGEPRLAIEGYLTLPPEVAFHKAYHLLLNRYGNKFDLANSFLSRLRSWPRITGTDTTGLRNFVDYLQQCISAKANLKGLHILDGEAEIVDMTRKLPVWLARDWSRKAAAYRKKNEEFPSFTDFVDFLVNEDEMAHDPCVRALHKPDTTRGLNRGTSFAAESDRTTGLGSSFGACAFCREKHHILNCTKFKIKALEFRKGFIRDNRLCYACLGRNHQARDCKNRRTCDICQGRHPTIMHSYETPAGDMTATASATTCAVNNYHSHTPTKSAMIVPGLH